MSHEFEPSESRSGLRTDLETLEAVRTGYLESVYDYYFCPTEEAYAVVADSQLALVKQFGETLDTIYYFNGLATYDKFDLIRDLQINEDAARIDFFNFMVEEQYFEPAKVLELKQSFPDGVLEALPEEVDFECYKNTELANFIENANLHMSSVLMLAHLRCATDSYRRLAEDT